MITKLFRTQLVLMLVDHWGYGSYVTDPLAFGLRLHKWMERR